MVHRRVVEPGRDLDALVCRVTERRHVREGDLRVDLGERVADEGEVAVVERVAVGVLVRDGVLRQVRHLPRRVVGGVRVVQDVGGVVGDDVEEDLHAAVVGEVDEGLELLVGAQVGVDLREVGDPVAVVAGRLGPRLTLDGLVLERRCHPDRRRAEALDVVQALDQTLQVAAVVEGLIRRVVPVVAAGALDEAGVVRRVAVLEPVGHDEVEVLACEVLAQAVPGERPVGVRQPARRLGRADRDLVRGVVVGEAKLGVLVDRQRDVAVGQAERGVTVVLVPRAVEPHLVEVVERLGRVPGGYEERPGEQARQNRAPAGGRSASTSPTSRSRTPVRSSATPSASPAQAGECGPRRRGRSSTPTSRRRRRRSRRAGNAAVNCACEASGRCPTLLATLARPERS